MNFEAEVTKLDILDLVKQIEDSIYNGQEVSVRTFRDLKVKVEQVEEPSLKESLEKYVAIVEEVLFTNKYTSTEKDMEKAAHYLIKMKEDINRIEAVRKNNAAAQQNKEKIERMEENHRTEYYLKKDTEYYNGFLSVLTHRVTGERIYTDEAIEAMSQKEKQEIVEMIKASISKDAVEKIEKKIEELEKEVKIEKEEKNVDNIDIGTLYDELDKLSKQIEDITNQIRTIKNMSNEQQKILIEQKEKIQNIITIKIEEYNRLIIELETEKKTLESENNYQARIRISELNSLIHELKILIENMEIKNSDILNIDININISLDEKDTEEKTTEEENKTATEETSEDSNDDDAKVEDDKKENDPEKTLIDGEDIIPEEEVEEQKKYDHRGAINELKNSIIPEMPEEEIKRIIDIIDDMVIMLFRKEQTIFVNNLASLTTVEEKLKLITEREEQIAEYIDLMKHENPEIDKIIEPRRTEMEKYLVLSYEGLKKEGEYVWANSEDIKASKNYIYKNLGEDEIIEQFNEMLNKMEDIIKSPNKKQYEEWQNGMKNFADNQNLVPEKMTQYMTARAKMINDKVSVDKDFNINGLNLNRERKRVVAVKDKEETKTFFQKHPKLKMLAIGLAIVLGSQVALGGVMMVNSALWSVLGGKGAICTALHGINLALSKVVGLGAFKFTSAGTYALAGKAGALSLYSAVGAKLTAAALAIGGPIGALVAKKMRNKNRDKLEEIELSESKTEEETEEKKSIFGRISKKQEMKEELENYKQQVEEMKRKNEAAIEAMRNAGLSEEDINNVMQNNAEPEEENNQKLK